MSRPFHIIVALDSDFGIGKAGGLPWRLPGELRHFREVTTSVSTGRTQNAVVMGRKTWESLPPKFRPLPGRMNLVLSRNTAFSPGPGAVRVAGFAEALEQCAGQAGLDRVFVIGGAELFHQALGHPACAGLYVTRVKGSFGCDVFFPRAWPGFTRAEVSLPCEESGITYFFERYEKIR